MLVRFLFAATVGRTGVFLLPVGLFFVAANHGPGRATAIVGLASAVTVGRGLALWPAGRLLDRVGPWAGLRRSMVIAALCLAGVAAAVHVVAPMWVQFAGAALAGTLTAPLIATPRAVLPVSITGRSLLRASAWEAATIEVALLAAPLLAALLSRGDVQWVLLGAAVALGLGWMVMPLQGEEPGADPADRNTRLVTSRVAGLAALAALMGFSGGLLEPGLAALPPPLPGWRESAALLFVAIGVGSFAGGAVAARVGWPNRPVHALPLLVLHAASLAVAVATPGGGLLVATLVIAGLPFAPMVSLSGLVLDRWTASGRKGETFAVIAAALEVGTGIGQAVAGHLLTVAGPSSLVLLSAGPPLIAAAGVTVAIRRRG